LHDIRRTVASGMARLGINLPVIEKLLNHVS
jgi:integrase